MSSATSLYPKPTLRVATATAMLFALVVAPSRRGVMSFTCRSVRRNNNLARRYAALHFSSTNQSQEKDYNTMKVSELRDLLRDRGLAVSGIKAQLVERLESERNNWGNPIKPGKGKHIQLKFDDEFENYDGVVEDDLGGLVDQLGTIQGEPGMGSDAAERRKRNNSKTRMPSNLVFEQENDQDGDGWDDDYDEDEYADPNQTVGMPKRERSHRGKKTVNINGEDDDTATFKDDFRGTRVFVQGLGKDTDWKDVRYYMFSHNLIIHHLLSDVWT